MTSTLLSEQELVDLIGGQINRSVGRLHARQAEDLPEVLSEFGLGIARAVAAAIHANNQKTLELASGRGEAPVSAQQYYDHLSRCVDGY